MSDVSSVVNYFATANEGFNTTTSGAVSSGATSVGLNSVSGLVNGTIFVGIIDPGLATQRVFTGTVNTGTSSITGVKWTRGTAASGNNAGAQVVDYSTGTARNMMVTGILKQHNQDGTHGVITATSVTTTGAVTAGNGLTVSGGSLSLPAGSISTAAIADSAITPAKMLGVDLFGRGSAVVGGTPPTAGTGQFYIQAATATAVTSSGGVGSTVFPTAFPNGVVSVVICQGDNTAGNSAFAVVSGATTSGFSFQCSAANTNVRINWIAIGW